MVKDGALIYFYKILNLEVHQNCFIGLKVTVILMNGGILSSGGVASGRVCPCSLRNRLVYHSYHIFFYFFFIVFTLTGSSLGCIDR